MSGWILFGAAAALALALALLTSSRRLAAAIANRRRSLDVPAWPPHRVRAAIVALGVLALLISAANLLAVLLK